MKHVVLLVCSLFSFVASAEVPSGSHNGYFFLENRIRTKMIKTQDKSSWTLISHLTGSTFPPGPNGIESLLGMYNNGIYQNGLPNALNWTLYNLLFTRFAQSFASSCAPFIQSSLFQHTAVEIAKKVCEQAKDAGEISEQTLLDLWLTTMGYDASFNSFEAWARFANSHELRVMPPKERLALMTKVVFLNPYSLIRH